MDTNPLQRAVDLCGGQSALAKAVGVKQGHVWYWLNEAKHVPAEYCAAIEEATGGAVTKHMLRPDLYEAPASQGGQPEAVPADAEPKKDAAA